MTGEFASLVSGATFEDRYEILTQLGEGGFGTVYKAKQGATGQHVALKIMHLAGAVGATQAEKRTVRFLREAQMCAQMNHPHIVQLIDAGQCSDGRLFTVFAFAPGDTLADILAAEGALAPREARHLMLQVLDALACAHACGIVHRDIKPRNIMVVSTGARRNAVVLDFGIGAVVGGVEDTGQKRLTATNETIGTPGYAAPEQWRGLTPTPRADLFAWGLVFLECLTGKPVYFGTSAEILARQLGDEPVTMPSVLDGHPLGDILRRATRKDVTARDVTARDLLEMLDVCDIRGLSREVLRDGSASESGATVFETRTVFARWHESHSTAQREHSGERRQVTAVCCNLTVRAATARRLGVDEEDDLLRASLAACADLARREGGHVVSAMGEDMLFYFGFPRADEDDAKHAARAVLAILAAIQADGPRLVADGVEIEARVGIHTGLVVADRQREMLDTDLVAGTTARLAARLAREAPPAAVLVSLDAHKLLRDSFDLVVSGRREDAAAETPLKTYQLVRERSEHATRLTPDGSDAPFVGRGPEIELLLDRWRRTRVGTGHSVLVTGEPGIGKSRLARELRGRVAAEPHVYLDCRCSPDTRNSALYPIIDVLARALGLDRDTPPREQTARLATAVERYGLSPAEVMPFFAPLFSLPLEEPYAPLQVSPQKQKELTLNGILALFFGIADGESTLLLVEDLHWADPTTLELLGRLVHELPSTSICLLLTARPDFSPSFPTAGVLQLQLSRLERPQIDALVTSLLNQKLLPPAVLEQVANRTDGVPLFVEELTRMMVDSDALVERGGGFELSRPLADLQIPTTLRALLTARLDRTGRAKETAQLAAALGREFDAAILSAVSSFGSSAVEEDLDALMAAGLVFRRRRVKGAAYVFKHMLVRDAAYESLAKGAQQRAHARIAAVLEQQFQGVVEARPDLLAHHHAGAEQKRTAIKYAQRAAMASLQRSAFGEAIGHSRMAIAWVNALATPEERAQTELGLNGILTIALMAHRGYPADEVGAVLERSRTLLDIVGDSPHSMPTLWALCMYHHLRRHRSEARALAERMLALAELTQDSGHLVVTLPLLSQCLLAEGRFEEARAHVERALSLYDPQAHRGHAFAYGLDSRVYAGMTLAGLLLYLGYPDRSLALGMEAVQWAREMGHNESIGTALFYLAGFHVWRGERDKTLDVVETVTQFADLHGLELIKLFAAILRCWCSYDLEGARAHVAGLRAAGQQYGMSAWNAFVAELEIEAGEHQAALERLEECLHDARESGETYYVAELLRLKGISLSARDPANSARAEECLREAVEVSRRQRARLFELLASLALARLLQTRGNAAEAKSLLQPLVDAFTEGTALQAMRDARALLA